MLNNKRILIVEDDNQLAQQLSHALRLQGAVVLGPAPTPFYALHLLGRRGIDVAILDDMLHGTPVFEFADELARRAISMVFTPDRPPEAMPERFRSALTVPKPYEHSEIIESVVSLTSARTLAELQHPIDTCPRREDAETTSQDRLMRVIGSALRTRRTENAQTRLEMSRASVEASMTEILARQSCIPQ